jgi:hypothetical protein
MANPARLMSIDDHQIFNIPINQSNSPRSHSDMLKLPETTILHITPEIIDQNLAYLPLEDKACFIITATFTPNTNPSSTMSDYENVDQSTYQVTIPLQKDPK